VATPVDLLRVLIADTDPARRVLDDADVAKFLELQGQPTNAPADPVLVRYAAADALDAIASSEALVSKKIRTQTGTSTDGPAVAASLRAHAQSLRAQAERIDADADSGIDVIEFTPYPWRP